MSMFGGRDATEAFMEYHGRHFPVKQMEEYCEGILGADQKPTQMDEDYLTLSREVAQFHLTLVLSVDSLAVLRF